MRKIAETTHLAIFESDEFSISEFWTTPKRLYAGFPLDELLNNPLPAVTALVTFVPCSRFDPPAPLPLMFFDWLETSREADAYGVADELRQEFMDALLRHLPGLEDSDPEMFQDADGEMHYVDTTDAIAT